MHEASFWSFACAANNEVRKPSGAANTGVRNFRCLNAPRLACRK